MGRPRPRLPKIRTLRSLWGRRSPPLDRDLPAGVNLGLRRKPRERAGTVTAHSKGGPALDQANGRDRSQATRIVTLATEHAVFWRTPDLEAFATIGAGGHLENWPIRSRGFRSWLASLTFKLERRAASAQATEEALRTVEGFAFEGDCHEVFSRIGCSDMGAIYLDLCNERWEAIEIDCLGWRVLESEKIPILFRRAAGMQPLPSPMRGGSVDLLRQYLNLESEDDFHLAVGWLFGAFRPRGPYPVLNLEGEQGSAKSTTARFLRALVDPNRAPIRAEPREQRDLLIAARNGWVIGFDNLSRVPAWLSDALCRLATGGGFGARSLYSDAEETIFDAMRPAMLNGIASVARRGDLLDRSIVLTLPRISEGSRRTETEIWRAFEMDRPEILGALLGAVSAALLNESAVRLQRVPRMADFAVWVTAAERALGMAPGAFLEAYARNRERGHDTVLEGSLIAATLLELLERDTFDGTASALFALVNDAAPDSAKRAPSWPRSAQALSTQLRRLAPSLRGQGYAVTFYQTQGPHSRKRMTLRKGGLECDAADA
jgi:hypothetical protein